MKIIADTHTHTVASGHAHSTLMENINEAKKKELKFLATTDHTGIMPDAPHDSYFACLRATVPDICNGVYLIRGCEVNILDEMGRVDVPDSLLSRLEWVIASIHGLLTKPMDKERHTQLWLNIAKNPHIDVIGHCGEDTFCFDYEKVIPEFAKYGKIVEINASSAISRPTSQKNCFKIAQLCAKHGVPLVLSSDAHFASDVGNVELAIKLVEEAGVPKEFVLNADAKRFAKKLTEITGRMFEL